MSEPEGAEGELYKFIKEKCEQFDKGVPWYIIERWAAKRLYSSTVIVLLEGLLDKGLVYEPMLGRVKVI